jgi:hypothetical protein
LSLSMMPVAPWNCSDSKVSIEWSRCGPIEHENVSNAFAGGSILLYIAWSIAYSRRGRSDWTGQSRILFSFRGQSRWFVRSSEASRHQRTGIVEVCKLFQSGVVSCQIIDQDPLWVCTPVWRLR